MATIVPCYTWICEVVSHKTGQLWCSLSVNKLIVSSRMAWSPVRPNCSGPCCNYWLHNSRVRQCDVKWLAAPQTGELHSDAIITDYYDIIGIQMVSITKCIANKCIQIYLLYKHFINHCDFRVNRIQFYCNMSINDLWPFFKTNITNLLCGSSTPKSAR